MKSQIRENMIANEKIVHNGFIEAKKLFEISQMMDIKIQKLADKFQLKEMARHKIREQKGKVKVKLYTMDELQKIQKLIKKDVKNGKNINQELVKKIQKKYKIGDMEIRIFFNISYQQLAKIKKNETYQIKNETVKKLLNKEIQENYRFKSYIYSEDIQKIKQQYCYNSKQIAKIFREPIEKIRNLENQKIKKIRIYLYTQKDKKEIMKTCKTIIQKQKCSLRELQEILQKEPYDKEIILELLGITKIQYENLKKGKVKKVIVSNAEIKQKVQMCLFDIENLYKYGKKEYQEEELKNILKQYELEIREFIKYSDKKARIRKMYQQGIRHNKKIQFNPNKKMEEKFFQENKEILQKKIQYIVRNFCITHQCNPQEIEDYQQDIYESIWSQGGFVTQNIGYNTQKCINQLCHMAKAKLINLYYKKPLELRIDISYYQNEIPQDYNKNFLDTRFSPEQILEQKEEITLIHRIIVQAMAKRLDFVLEMEQDFWEVLTYELDIKEEEKELLIQEIRLIILQNKLAKQDKYGRIIPMDPTEE